MNMNFYSNTTLAACQCLLMNNIFVAFQYDYQQRSCHTMSYLSNFTNIRITPTSLLCWYNRTTTTLAPTTTTLPGAPITHSVSVTGSNYYTTETVTFSNNSTLSSFAAMVIVPKTMSASYQTMYGTFWSGTVSMTYNETTDFIQYNYKLNQGNTIPVGSWSFSAQFALTGTARLTANDTYIIRIDSYQTITGRF